MARNTLPNPAKLRRIALRRQGLAGARRLGTGLAGMRKTLERLGYVQIDTISVVARAHHHTFFTRVSRYDEAAVNRLLRARQAFEYWCHAAAYLPMRDYRFAVPMMRAKARGELWNHRADAKVRAWVLARIRAEGPLFARDFEHPPRQSKGWWDWKPAKRALEQLFMEGELMIAERQGFQKRYELAERFLPAGINATEPTLTEHADHVIDVGLGAHGFATEATLAYFRRDARVRAAVRKRLAVRVRQGELVKTRTNSGERIYAPPGAFDATTKPLAPVVRILSPFDNAVIQRRRSVEVFGFDYTIECYLPEAKRRYGYFALPILFADRLVGRMDCKAHRPAGGGTGGGRAQAGGGAGGGRAQAGGGTGGGRAQAGGGAGGGRAQGRFEIKALYLEDAEATASDAFPSAFAAAVREYAAFTGCGEVQVRHVSPPAFSRPLKQLFA